MVLREGCVTFTSAGLGEYLSDEVTVQSSLTLPGDGVAGENDGSPSVPGQSHLTPGQNVPPEVNTAIKFYLCHTFP